MNPMGNCLLKKSTTGLGKRGPPTELSRELAEKGLDQSEAYDRNIPGDKICNEAEIKSRKILKIKRRSRREREKVLKPIESSKRGLILEGELPKQKEKGLTGFFSSSASSAGLFTGNGQNTEPKGWVPKSSGIAGQDNDIDNGGASFFGNGAKSAVSGQNKDVNFGQNTSSLFASNTDKKQEEKPKAEEKQQSGTGGASLFGNPSGGLFAQGEVETKGLFGGSGNQTDDKKQPEGGLFGGSNKIGSLFAEKAEEKKAEEKTTGGLFGQVNVEKKQEEPEKKSTGLFGDGSSATGGLFDNSEKKEEAKQEKAPGGFFANNDEEKESSAAGGGLFGDLQSSGGGLFAGLVDPSASNNTKGLNIFSESVKSTGLFANNQDSQKEQAPVEKEVKINKAFVQVEFDPTKKFEYEEVTTTLFSAPVTNFKVNKIPGYGAGTVAIEKFKANNTVSLLFRNAAQAILSNTILYKGISTKGYMKGKKDAIYVYTFRQGEDTKEEDGTVVKGKIERCQCKMAFTEGESKAKEFMNVVEGVIKKD